MSLRSLLTMSIALCGALPSPAQQYTWSVVAGLPPQFGSTDGSAANARFYNPNSLVADANGNLYVTDTFNHTIRKIAPDGTASTIAGTPRSSGTADGTGPNARFSSPIGIVLDAAGNLLVADRVNHAIRKVTPAGVVTTVAGLPGTSGSVDGTGSAARFNLPAGLVLDREGNLWVTDSGNHTIRRLAPDGVVTTIAGLAGTSGSVDGTGSAARFNSPFGIAVAADGDFFISDLNNHTLRRMTRDGAVSTYAGSAGTSGTANGTLLAARFNFPSGLALDASGNLYVADTYNDCIRRITPAGIVSVYAGGADVRGSANGTATTARFYSPYNLTFGPSGDLFVADTLNHTIRRITPTQVVSNHSGPGGNFGNTDGTGTAARFNYPQGIALDADDSLVIADWRNAEVRRLTAAGTVSTVQSFAAPFGITVGGGLMVVSDRSRHVLRVYLAGTANFVDVGTSNLAGSTDGPLATALFNQPHGVAVDPLGRVLVADTANRTIRLLASAPGSTGINVSTLAGLAGISGSTNGAGNAARFSAPSGIAVDVNGIVYVADSGAHTIRKISGSAANVTTLAGLAFTSGTANGVGTAARFNSPEGIVADVAGFLYVADRGNHAIRRIAPDGTVTTLGGFPGFPGHAEGTGQNARFSDPTGVALDSKGAIYVVSSANNVIMRGVLDTTPVITAQPQSSVLAIGGSASLSVSATGGGLSYQWRFNGTAIANATGSTYTLTNAQADQSGRYTVDVLNSAGLTTSAAATLTVKATVDVSRIVNLAIRSQAGTGPQTLIVGVGVGGSGTLGSQPILVRGIGPTLGAFGVAGTLADPKLELYLGATKINENDNWGGDPRVSTIGSQVGAFGLSNPASRDAALYLPSLAPGSYSVQITGGTGSGAPTGVALAEVYDATPAASRTATTPRLTNVSARTQVGTEGDVLIAGFVIAGETSKTVLIRAIGPTLGSFGVTGTLADPKLELFGASGKITENDNWGGLLPLSTTFFNVGAFPLTAASKDAVLLVTLAPGSYTAQVSGVGATTGVALVEVYEVP